MCGRAEAEGPGACGPCERLERPPTEPMPVCGSHEAARTGAMITRGLVSAWKVLTWGGVVCTGGGTPWLHSLWLPFRDSLGGRCGCWKG